MLSVWSLPPEGTDPAEWPWDVLFGRRWARRKPQVIELRWAVGDYSEDGED
jgi:hypothetical protein